MEERLAQSSSLEEDLQSQLSEMETEKLKIETEFKSLSETTSKTITDLESQLSETKSHVDELQLDLSSAQQEVGVATEDTRKYSEQAASTQDLYERELLQHGKSMESLHRVKEEVRKELKLISTGFRRR